MQGTIVPAGLVSIIGSTENDTAPYTCNCLVGAAWLANMELIVWTSV